MYSRVNRILFFFFFFPPFIFHSRCWPIIHHSGRGGPLKSCLFSWAEGGKKRFQLKSPICAWLPWRKDVRLFECTVGIGTPADDISSYDCRVPPAEPSAEPQILQRGGFLFECTPLERSQSTPFVFSHGTFNAGRVLTCTERSTHPPQRAPFCDLVRPAF